MRTLAAGYGRHSMKRHPLAGAADAVQSETIVLGPSYHGEPVEECTLYIQVAHAQPEPEMSKNWQRARPPIA